MSVILQPQTSDNFYQSFVAPAWNGSSRRRKSEIKKNRRKNERETKGLIKRELIIQHEHDHHYHKKNLFFNVDINSNN
jgi:hypothetical protein